MNVRNALGKAIAANDAEEVSRLIATGADIGIKGEQGGSMLHLAAMADADRVIHVLIKAGLAVNAPAVDGTMPLHMAALLGNLAAADALIAEGADANAALPHTGDTPLLVAAAGIGNPDSGNDGFDHPGVIASLLKAGADAAVLALDATYAMDRLLAGAANLVWEAGKGADGGMSPHEILAVLPSLGAHGVKMAKADDLLRAAGAPMRAAPESDEEGARLAVDLLNAAAKGDAAAVRRLIAAGASADAKADDGMTVLMAAIHGGDEQTCSIVIAAGATLDAANARGLTALHGAVLKGRLDLVRLLLDFSPNVDACDRHGVTPLHFACGGGQAEIAAALVAEKANVNVQDSRGATPLLAAAIGTVMAKNNEGCPDCVAVLMLNGADPALGDRNGLTPLNGLLSAARQWWLNTPAGKAAEEGWSGEVSLSEFGELGGRIARVMALLQGEADEAS